MDTLQLVTGLITSAWEVGWVGGMIVWSYWVMIMHGGTGHVQRLADFLITVHQELWPFALPGIILPLLTTPTRSAWLPLIGALETLAWWKSRNWPSDDDRWNRRRRKAANIVRQLGGRLVVRAA